MARRTLPPALLTAAELDQWLAGLGLPREERRRLRGRALVPITFTTPAGDYWTIEPLITGAWLVSPGLPAEE